MRRITLLLSVSLFLNITLSAQTIVPVQYASSVIAVSSEFGSHASDYRAIQALGKPDAWPACGSSPRAWTTQTNSGQREFIVLGFSNPQPVNNIRIYQAIAPGSIDTVYVRNASTGVWNQVFSTTAAAPGNGTSCPGAEHMILEITIPITAYNVDAVRIALNSPAVTTYYKEIDAVAIAAFDQLSDNYNQYVSSVIGFSSEYSASPGGFSAQKIIGPPDASAGCGTHSNAWASLTQNGQREYLVAGYAYPAIVNRVMIHQQIAPGAVDTVYLREYGTNIWHEVYSATAAEATGPCISNKLLEINFTKTNYYVDAVRIAINSPAVTSYWNEIDAIGIRCELPANAIRSQQSGNWSEASTWAGGIVPAGNDTVIIGPHNIILDADGASAALIITNGGGLTMNTAGTLTVGPFASGGGNKTVDVQGALNISNGTLNIGGRIKFNTNASFVMNGGMINIDGNDGSEQGSVPDNQFLADFPTGMASCNITGGTITLVDPPYGSTGNTLRSVYNFAAGSTLRLGNGISVTAGGNINGFNLVNSPAQTGHLIVDAATGSNRRVTLNRSTTINGSVTVSSGQFQNNSTMIINGELINNGSVVVNSTARSSGSLTNNAVLSITGGSLSIGGDLTNNAGAAYTVAGSNYTSVKGNVVNNGTLSTHWLFFADDFNTASTNAQTIGGTGSFSIYGLEIVNANNAGVALLLSLEVQQIYFVQGKLFLGANDLTFNSTSSGYGSPGSASYVVTNGTGRLIYNGLAAAPVLFPVGTAASYTPVTIANGSGHTFSCNVQNGFTHPLPGNEHVQRQWNIVDITGGTVSADLSFQWNAADEHASFNRNACAVMHYGTGWSTISNTAAASGTDPYTRSVTGAGSFSPFAITSNSVSLPLTLLHFTASKEGNGARLGWQTASEENVSHFEVEKSTDGIRYSVIATTAAVNAAGIHDYTAKDESPANGINYYRLRMVDIDNKFTYSNTALLDFSGKNRTVVAPNPASGKVIVISDKKIREIILADMSGKIINRFTPSPDNRYDISNAKPGAYILKIITGNGVEATKLLIR